MLPRKDLGRRHERPLPAALHRLDEREQGDRRLARTHIPLHKAAHRQRRLHIACDLRPHRLLILRQRKRQSLQHCGNTHTVFPVGDPALRLHAALFECEQSALDEVEFFKGKTAACVAQLLRALWKMNPAKGVRPPDEAVFRAHDVRQRLRQILRRLAQRVCHHLPQLFLRESFGRRVDRQDAEPRRRRLLRAEKFERGDLREGELPAAPIGIVRLAREKNASPFAQLAL